VPVDAIWWALVDPATLLFTQAYREEIPVESGPYFVENEFLRDDVNKWTAVASTSDGVRTLVGTTEGRVAESARYRDIFEPLGLEDELRVVLRSRGEVWGFMCLHREKGSPFSRREVAFVQRIAPHIADGLRLGLFARDVVLAPLTDAPGLILLAADGSVVSRNQAAEQWLEELNSGAYPLPLEIDALAARLRSAGPDDLAPQLSVRSRAGRWVTLQASSLCDDSAGAVAVIIQPATAEQLAPVVMRAYGLTERERVISRLVFHGRSTRAISEELEISTYTVQDHIKSIFEKTGVRSRRELVATVLRQQYLPNAHP